MMYLPTGMQMKEADLYTIEQIGLPSMVLMERAALQVMEVLEKKSLDLSRILVVCGPGNNGGDGYAIARLLHLKGIPVELYFMGKEEARSTENRTQKQIADYYQIPTVDSITEKEYSVIIDAVFGTGLKRNLEENYYELISCLNQMTGTKVAVDIPSGVHDATGEIMGIAFQADITVAIAFEKRGLAFFPGAQYAGEIRVVDIGITDEAFQKKEEITYSYELGDLKQRFPKRKKNSHKGTYGKVLLIAGSRGMSGAAYLSAKAAYAVGAGLVQIYTSEDNRTILQQLLPEAIISTYDQYDEKQLAQLLKWAGVIGIGSGLGKSEISWKLVQQTLETTECPCVVDADALNLIAEHMKWLSGIRQELIFTPHMKEMQRLLQCMEKTIPMQELQKDRMEYLMKFTEQYPVVCALKDARTLVAKQSEAVYINLSGNAAMAKAGAGDVLAGMIAGIVGQGIKPYDAACIGVYLHGLAGDAAKHRKGSYSVLASDIIEGISEVLKEI